MELEQELTGHLVFFVYTVLTVDSVNRNTGDSLNMFVLSGIRINRSHLRAFV